MGTYVDNVYDLRIPLTEVGGIIASFKEAMDKTGHYWLDEWKEHTPEVLADLIASTYGASEVITVGEVGTDSIRVEGSDLILQFTSYGKDGMSHEMTLILGAHRTRGTIQRDVEGSHVLLAFDEEGVAWHRGEVTFPTYEGSST